MKVTINRAKAYGLMSKILCSVMIAMAFISFESCEKEDDDNKPKTSGFTSAEEYIENPSVIIAKNEAGIEINKGDNPPALAGVYLADGKVTNASYDFYSMVGERINSQITLYSQTNTGKINFKEVVQGITVQASGGYITGENGKFTIYQESIQTGSEAGLPDDLTITVVLIMSGTKLSNGNLSAKGMSVITDIKADAKKYPNKDSLKGLWWMWQAEFKLTAAATSSLNSAPVVKSNLPSIISSIITIPNN
jgi:hypothetical protein